MAHQLSVPAPSQWSYIVRTTRVATPADREAALEACDYNLFAYPASLLIADFLSAGGCSAASDVQWAALMRGDEAYGRNHGYFALLDAVRDVFERGVELPGGLCRRLIVNEPNPTWRPDEAALSDPPCGGFANGGHHQLVRPNFFITPQQRCAEFLLFNGLRKVVDPERQYYIPSNGFFDTTEAHARDCRFVPVNMVDQSRPNVPMSQVRTHNNFKGDIDLAKLKAFIAEKGAESILFVMLTLTNSREAGHPVSMRNIVETAELAHSHNIPVVFDAARFALNAWAIHTYEDQYKAMSIAQIVKEMFAHCDAFVVGCKNSSNAGGFLSFRDQGVFHKRFSTKTRDVGIVIKEMQILSYGNDSYGGLSGRDIMAMAVGISQLTDAVRLERHVNQTLTFAERLVAAGVPGVMTSGSAVYVDVDEFFGARSAPEDYRGMGLVSELIRLYGVRIAEIGPFTFPKGGELGHSPNYVRISVPFGTYSDEHILYAVAAIAELHRNKERLPKMKIVFGERLNLRHFQAGLKPIYPAEGKLVD
uniref:Tryptophanase 1 n=1 Tax=Mastigamoeba balamuthi TaxID=108607 RepID=A0A1S5WM52_MASBA|nr:tryptophanase 1 [Mastigamoeba balamuthi]|eukprot:m51a1_g666 tryptophanase (533) ;mRNA; r:241406-243751